MIRLLTATAIAASVFAAAPALAQDTGGDDDKVNQLIVYGNDPCPASVGNEITVCARKPEEERYRIPTPLRGIDQPQSEAWANKVQAYEMVGKHGLMSCSPIGGGQSGCTQQFIDRAYAEKANGSEVRFAELIQAEREKRLATIDANAAEEQKRVESEEDAYFAAQKQKREAAAAAAGAQPAPAPR